MFTLIAVHTAVTHLSPGNIDPAVLFTGLFVCAFCLEKIFSRHVHPVIRQRSASDHRALYESARMVHESRESTRVFMERNPHESFASPRGKAMLLFHLQRYEEYLTLVGVERRFDGKYRDAYWIQLKGLVYCGKGRNVLPTLPHPANPRHFYLQRAQ